MDEAIEHFKNYFGVTQWSKNKNRYYLNKFLILYEVGCLEDRHRLLKNQSKFYYQKSNNKLYCKDGNDKDCEYLDLIQSHLKKSGIEINSRR